MAKQKYLYTEQATAAVDLLTRYRYVTLDNTGKAVLPAAGARVVGTVEEPAKAGRPLTYAIGGRLKVEAGAAIVAGALIQTDATGRAITQTSTNIVLGIARTAASAAGVLIEVEAEAR